MKKGIDDVYWAAGFQELAKAFQNLDGQLTLSKVYLERLALFIQFLDKVFPEFCQDDQMRLKTLIATFVESFEGSYEK